MGASLRIELFVSDLERFTDFYRRVLGFAVVRETSGYAAVARDGVLIGASVAWEPVDVEARSVPTGVELVIDVDDVRAERDRVRAAGWPFSSDLTERPWGLTDFRIFDPDGHYLRFTSREPLEAA